MGYFPVNAIALVLLVETGNSYFDITLSNLCTDFCNKVSDFEIITL
jgi:hypothetical protein